MCVGFFSLEHPDYALILCTNRDEFLSRPTTEAHFHDFGDVKAKQPHGRVLSGRDARAGGTWLGINRTGRVALLTNITEPAATYASSRGHLTSSFLLSQSSHPLGDEVGKIIPGEAKYAGFNLLLLAPSSVNAESIHFDASFVTNGGGGGVITARPLSDQERHCGGISNGIDGKGASEWPKVKHGVCALSNLLSTLSPSSSEDDAVNHLFDILRWESECPPHERSELRNTIQVKPFPLTDHSTKRLVPIGTRLSTVLLIRRDGRVLFIERDIWTVGQDGDVKRADQQSQRVFRFQLAPQNTG